jgi:hypothetical protein
MKLINLSRDKRIVPERNVNITIHYALQSISTVLLTGKLLVLFLFCYPILLIGYLYFNWIEILFSV